MRRRRSLYRNSSFLLLISAITAVVCLIIVAVNVHWSATPPLANYSSFQDEFAGVLKHKEALLELEKQKAEENELLKNHSVEKITRLEGRTGAADLRSIENKPPSQDGTNDRNKKICAVVVCFNRAQYLERTLNSVLDRWPSGSEQIEFFISQDGNHPGVEQIALKYTSLLNGTHLKFQYDKNSWTSGDPNYVLGRFEVYYRISAHYYFIFNEIFHKRDCSYSLIIEDDMDLAPDFFPYFFRMKEFLSSDPGLLCISAWNDNGQENLVNDPEMVYRTHSFPGLGWMLHKHTWTEEFATKWPPGFWDDWIRLPTIMNGRSCIYPEINRVYTFGKIGSSNGQFFDDFLVRTRLNQINIDWKSKDLLTVSSNNAFENWINSTLKSAIDITAENLVRLEFSNSSSIQNVYRISYDGSESSFEKISRQFGIMHSFRANIPRASFHKIVPFRRSNLLVLLYPQDYYTLI